MSDNDEIREDSPLLMERPSSGTEGVAEKTELDIAGRGNEDVCDSGEGITEGSPLLQTRPTSSAADSATGEAGSRGTSTNCRSVWKRTAALNPPVDARLPPMNERLRRDHMDKHVFDQGKATVYTIVWPSTEDALKTLFLVCIVLFFCYLGIYSCFHSEARSRLMRIEDASYGDDCRGVKVPQTAWGAGLQVFPNDVFNDDLALLGLLTLNRTTDLAAKAICAKSFNLFAYPTYPWAQWTWLQLLRSHDLPRGGFAEFGVGLGGSSIFLAGLAKMHGAQFVGFDSFAGLPRESNTKDLPYFPSGAYDFRKTHQKGEQRQLVEKAVQQCGIRTPDDATFVQGYFKDVKFPTNSNFSQLAFVHLDGDLYDSIYTSLSMVYDRVPDNGIIAVDDFFHPAMGPKRAVEDFFRAKHPGEMPLLYPVFPGYAIIIIKGHFADPSKGHRQNLLDGNFYSFDLIKGQADIRAAVSRSLDRTQLAYDAVKNSRSLNQSTLCGLSVALDSAERMRQFLEDDSVDLDGTEGAQIFRFMRDGVQFQDAESKELRLH